ncbi:protein mono-ADP-ribosyltransferase TIPARP-like [Rhincodon typus]|uniref:protein mono-ADP-ribosyltransferase TIPARP-like n=1 Tax=Rhincodon typus TaxID=259920 RepID=UPI00203099D2|nr:protein mono-ADP-ribosyltransferase TIPARP-like [Rhincodon typus]
MAGHTGTVASDPSPDADRAHVDPLVKISLVKAHPMDRLRRKKDSERLLRTLKHLIKKERVSVVQPSPLVTRTGSPPGLASLDSLAPAAKPLDLQATTNLLGQASAVSPGWELPSTEAVEMELREAESLGRRTPSCEAPAFPEDEMSLDHLLDVLTQLQYHTRQENGVSICSRFLVGCCLEGDCCPYHHTALPYHWQMRRAATQHWESVQEEGQEMLERLYCDPDKEKVTLRYRDRSFTADFDQMTIQNETFDELRRLSTSDIDPSDIFRTTWRYYWRDTFEWKEYPQSLAQYFEEALRQGFVVRYFMINQNQRYKVDLNARYQQNITSGTKRTIRKRPLFQSIVTLLPYLKTLSGSFETCPSVPESPSPAATNSDCEHMYPETWIPMDPNVDFIKVPMSLDDKAYRVVYNLFHKTMLETKFVILSILRVQNQFLWDKYIRKKQYMARKMSERERMLNEKHLFHGTSQLSIDGICKHNFDPRVSGRHATLYGQGSYFARKSSYSHRYAQRSEEGVHYMFLSKVLVGRHTVGKPAMRRPPAVIPNDPSSDLFNSCVDSTYDPQIFVLFDNDQCFPYFVVKYKEVGDSITVR